MSSILSFESTFVPRFEITDSERHEAENHSAQRTLWSAIQELLSTRRVEAGAGAAAGNHGPIVEIRLVAEPDNGRNRVLVNMRNVSEQDDAVQSLIRVLPPNFGWRTVPDPLRHFASSPALQSGHWYIARVERRINFVDLPWRLIDTLDTTGMFDASQSDTERPWNAVDVNSRQLLTRPLTRVEEELERYCLPVSGAVEMHLPSVRVLFQELRAQSPCIVSIALASVESTRLDSYRRIAMFWGAHLQRFGSEIANAGFADIDALRAQYDRFLLPDRFLCALTIQVAGTSAVASRSVALQLTARLGGLRSFTIRDPVEASLDMLGDPWNDVPNTTRWEPATWNRRRERLRRETARDGLKTADVEPLFEEFLIGLPHLYTIDEAAAIGGLPVADEEGLPGLDTRLVAPFSDASRSGSYPVFDAAGRRSPPPADRIRIGVSPRRDNSLAPIQHGEDAIVGDWHTIDPKDLTKHAFVVGSTGSGKTVTTLFLVRELARLSIPFLIIEPVKTEYYDRLKAIPGLELRRVRLEGTKEGRPDPAFLAFDPMRLQEGVSVSRHASYLKTCFESAFPLEPATAMILDAGIRGYYTDSSEFGCNLSLFSRGGRDVHRWANVRLKRMEQLASVVHPSLEGFQYYFLDVFLPSVIKVSIDQPRIAELYESWRQIFERRFEALRSGMIGYAAANAKSKFRTNPDNYNPFTELLSGRCILELDGIPDDEQKSLMMAFITTFLFERRQADDLRDRESDKRPDDRLRHVLIVEEAHRILANPVAGGRGELAGLGAQAKTVSLFVNMLAEIRAYGQGLIIVEQIPTKVVAETVKNTNLKIMLRLTAADDREFLGSAMNFSEEQKRFVTSLRAESGRGVDMVVFEQQLDQPRLLTLPLPIDQGGEIHASLFPPPLWRRN